MALSRQCPSVIAVGSHSHPCSNPTITPTPAFLITYPYYPTIATPTPKPNPSPSPSPSPNHITDPRSSAILAVQHLSKQLTAETGRRHTVRG